MATIGLGFQLSANAAQMSGGVNEAVKQLARISDSAAKTARDTSALKTIAIGSVVAKGVGMVADAFSSAARAAIGYATNVASSVDALNDLAERTGIGVEALQAFQMAAKLAGMEDATRGIQKLTLAIGQAAESGNTDAFTKLGLDFQQLQAMAPEEQFRAVQAAIAALPTPAERAAAAVSIFGKAGVEMLPMFNQNLEEIEARMRRLGAIVGTDQVEAIGSMNDALDMVKATFEGIVGNVVGNLAPVVESLANEILAMVESFNSVSGSGGEGIANAITTALLDIADYFAGIFDTAVANFDGFGTTMAEVGEVFKFAGNVFTAVGEILRAGFNAFQVAGNFIAMAIGKLLEGLGAWVNEDLEQFGRDLATTSQQQLKQNAAEAGQAAGNAVGAAGRAILGGEAEAATEGPAQRAVRAARQRMTPEAKAQREAERAAKQAEAKSAREAAAAKAKADKDAADAKKRQDEAAKKAAAIDEKALAKQEEIDKIQADKAAALGGQSNQALKANDIRSSEGMAQFIALATGREDPAIEENRKTNQKLEEIRRELRALQQEKVDILGAAA